MTLTSREETEIIARQFHYRYEQLAPHFRWETQSLSKVPWDDLPENQKNLMMATVAALRQEGVITYNPQKPFLEEIE